MTNKIAKNMAVRQAINEKTQINISNGKWGHNLKCRIQ